MTADALAQDCGLDLGCQAASSALDGITGQVAQSAADLLVTATTWWVRTDSVNPLDPAVTSAQGSVRGLVVLVLVASVLVQAIRLMLSRKGEPLVLVATGLVRYAIVSALGLVLLQGALQAGDAIAIDLLDNAAHDFAQLMREVLLRPQGGISVLLLSLVTAVFALIQWVLMALRQAGLLVLAAMLPLAASGSLNRSTRGWLDKLLVWLIAMVVYKPAAAFIYSIGFTYVSSLPTAESSRLSTMITGLIVLMLAVIALPVLLKFFSWSGTQVGGGGSGGSGFLGAAGAIALSQGGGRAAVDRAAAMDTGGPGSLHAAAGSAPVGAASAPAGGTAAGTAGSAGATGAAAAGESAGAAAAGGPIVAAGAAAAGAAARTVRRAGDTMTGQDDGTGS